MKTILFAILASCLVLAGCEKNETYIEASTGELRVRFTGEEQISPTLDICSIEQPTIPIATYPVHGPSRSVLTELNIGNYVIYPFFPLDNIPYGFQIRSNKRTVLKINPLGGLPEVEYEDL